MSAAASIAIPLLVEGERLTRAEFERRYEAMPEVKKAELLEGVVYMSSPVKATQHAAPHLMIAWWLGTYWSATPRVLALDNATLRLDQHTELQPDAMLLIKPEAGGRSVLVDDYVEGAPEFVAEVAGSSKSMDLGLKKRLYRRFNANEYLVWQVNEQHISWFRLRDGEYVEQSVDNDGRLRGEVFPGLWLDPAAMIAGDGPRVRAVLEAGLQSAEHAAFVAMLGQRAAENKAKEISP